MRRITAHELLISQYFEIYKRYYSIQGLKEGQIWALAEVAAFALTSLTSEVKKFWPWDTAYYTNHNYSQIVELQKKLKNSFLKRENFDDYNTQGMRLVRQYSGIKP